MNMHSCCYTTVKGNALQGVSSSAQAYDINVHVYGTDVNVLNVCHTYSTIHDADS